MPISVPYAPQQIYQPNGRLVDLIRAQGQDAARAAKLRGQQQAQLWSGVGNAIQGGVQSVLQATDPRRKIEAEQAKLVAGQVADAAARRGGEATVDAMMAGDQLPAGDAGPRQPKFLTADGLFDIPKMNAALSASHVAHLAPELLKGAESINDSITKHQALEQQAAQQQAVLLGDLAHGAITLHEKVGMPLGGAMDFVAQSALATKRITPEQYAQVKSRISSLPPDQQVAALNTFRDAASKLDKGDTLAKDAVHIDRYGRTESSNVVPEKRPDYTINGQRFNGMTNQPIGSQVAPIAAPVAAQTHTMRLKGVGDVPVDYVPNKDGSGGKWMYQGKDVTGQLTAIPSAAITIHNDQAKGVQLPSWATDDVRPSGPDANTPDPKIKMTPNGLHQAALNFIANGQFPPTGRGSDTVAVAQREAITSKVGAIAAASGMDLPALRAFYKANGASLVQEQKMQDAVQGFMATADKNAALLKDTLTKIPDIGSPMFNKPLRAFAKDVSGDPNLSKFATYLQSVQNEYGRIISQPNLAGQLTDSARHEAQTLASGNATVPQILASLDALEKEGSNRLVSVGEQIQRIQKRMQEGPNAPPKTGIGAALVPTLRFNPATGKVEKVGG